MIKSTNRISRRTLLRASGAAVGLPFLEAMLRPGQSHAQGEIPTRFVAFYNPGGTLLDNWRPSGTPAAWEFQPMLAPLAPFKQKINMVDVLDMTVAFAEGAGEGHHHCRGMAGCLTGHSLFGQFADGPSIDQIIADELIKKHGDTPFKSLEFAAGWGTGIGDNGPHSSNMLNMADDDQPLPPATDPLAAFNRIFGDIQDAQNQPMDQQVSASLQAFDAVARQYERVIAEVGYEDRQKLQQHLTLIGESRQAAADLSNTLCALPEVDQTPGAYEIGGVTAEQIQEYGGNPDAQSDKNVKSGEVVPKIGTVMTDMMVAALGCGLTNVASMQWGDSEAKFMLNFLNDADGNPLIDHHHGYQHDRGFQPDSLSIIYNWYAENLAHLLTRMDELKVMGEMSLLDYSSVVTVSEIQKPDSHSRADMPFLVAGGVGGALETGRWLQVDPKQHHHNHLLLSLCKLYGFQGDKVGNPEFCDGPLTGFA